jgi:hypothetical protein
VAYDHQLADDLRARVSNRPGVTEREMFGGVAFMIRGNMAVGVIGDDLMVRVGKEAHDEALGLPGTRVFDFTGRPMAGWVVVAREGFVGDDDLDAWVRRGVTYAESLPPK